MIDFVSNRQICKDLSNHFLSGKPKPVMTENVNSLPSLIPSLMPIQKMIKSIKAPTHSNPVIGFKSEYLFCPNEKDKLFWCFFIIKNGYAEYEMLKLNQSMILKENQEKIQNVERLRASPVKLKGFSTIEIDIMEPQTSVKVIEFLSHLEKVNICLVFPKSYYEIDGDPSSAVRNLIMMDCFQVDVNVSEEKWKKVKEGRLKRGDIHRMIKPISCYKLADLHLLCNQLNVDVEKRKKSELYDILLKLE